MKHKIQSNKVVCINKRRLYKKIFSLRTQKEDLIADERAKICQGNNFKPDCFFMDSNIPNNWIEPIEYV